MTKSNRSQLEPWRRPSSASASWRPVAAKLCMATVIVTAIAVATTACGVGGGLAASGGGGGGGSTTPPRPTSSIALTEDDAVGTEAHPAGNLVRLKYHLEDIDARTVNVFPEFRLPQSGQWRPIDRKSVV